MTGPSNPFEGRDGLWQHLGVEAPKWDGFGGEATPFRINYQLQGVAAAFQDGAVTPATC
jgi:hypothetical protein